MLNHLTNHRITLYLTLAISLLSILLTPQLSLARADVAESKEDEPGWMTRHNEFVRIAQQNTAQLVFIGDSITHMWSTEGKDTFKAEFDKYKAVNFGIGSERVENILWRVTNGEFDHGFTPKLVVLMIGTNNGRTADDTPEIIRDGIRKIIDEIHRRTPTTKVLLLHIIPPNNSRKEEVNELIQGLHNGSTIHVLNTNSVFLKSDGTKNDSLYDGSIVHLNTTGYQAWANALRPKITELMGGSGGPSYPPTISLRADPTTITAGGRSTLTWVSANATNCTGTGFSTEGKLNGTAVVTPTGTMTYILSCTGPGGTVTKQAQVTAPGTGIRPPATTTPTTTPPTGATCKKWFPGHYVRVEGLHNLDSRPVRAVTDNPTVFTGFSTTRVWRDLEPTRGNYNFDVIVRDLDEAQRLGKKVTLRFEDRDWSGGQALPADMLTDSVYQGGSYRHQGNNNIYYPKLWVRAVAEREAALLTALGARIDGHPALASIQLQESSLNGAKEQAGYTLEEHMDNLMYLHETIKNAFPRTVFIQFVNWGFGGGTTGEQNRASLMTNLVERNKSGFGGPDIAGYRPGYDRGVQWALDNNFGKFYTQYRGIAPISMENQASGYATNTPKAVLDYAVDRLGAHFIGWAPLDDRTWSFYDQGIPEIRRQNGRINTAPPRNITSCGTTTPPAPTTATLTANPATITSGGQSTLTWTSTNATTCTGQGFSTGNLPNGSTTVRPTTNTTYTLTCTKGSTSVQKTATVNVSSNPGPDPDILMRLITAIMAAVKAGTITTEQAIALLTQLLALFR